MNSRAGLPIIRLAPGAHPVRGKGQARPNVSDESTASHFLA